MPTSAGLPADVQVESLPAALGSPGLTQGAYGDAGNLELVLPAAAGGFWCLWFNADPVDHRKGAVRHNWSRPLHVPGFYCTSARIAQSVSGPRFLEAITVADGALWRQHWTPDDGFVDDGPVAVDGELVNAVVTSSALVEHGDSMHVLAVAEDGRLLHLRSGIGNYPSLRWSTTEIDTGVADVELMRTGGALVATVLDAEGIAHVRRYDAHGNQWHQTARYARSWKCATTTSLGIIGLDRSGHVLMVDVEGVHELWPQLVATDLAAYATTLAGGRFDVVLRVGTDLLHGYGRGSEWTEPTRIVSRTWA